MVWHERQLETQQDSQVDQARAAELDKAKVDVHQAIVKETGEGLRQFKPIKFQPVIGRGIFEAEFAEKDDDIIFHFWPYQYRLKQKEGKQLPQFPQGTENLLKLSLTTSFADNRIETSFDQDMGSFFVRAIGYAKSLDPKYLAVNVCKKFYELLGGKP
jgi:hypothetical protein